MTVFLKNIVCFLFGKSPFGTVFAERERERERERSAGVILFAQVRVLVIFFGIIITTTALFLHFAVVFLFLLSN